MSSRFRLLPALVGAAAVFLSALAVTAPAEATPQTALLAVYGPVNENVSFVAAGSVTPIKVGRRVELQVKSGSGWNTIDTVVQDQYGGLSFAAKIKRTKQAKDSVGYEWRYLRLRARASGALAEKVTDPKKVKVLLDPKVYYRVLKASVQHTANADMQGNGCGIGAPFIVTNKTSSGLGNAESGKPRWKAKRLADGSIRTELDPGLSTTWTQNLKGCSYNPSIVRTCETTRTDKPSGDGKERLGVRVSVPKSGSGKVLFFTRGLFAGFSSPDDSVCNVPYMTGGDVPVKIRTKTVSRATLLGKKAFTVVNQGQTSWTTDEISGRPAALKLRWTESIKLVRVDAAGRLLR